MSTRQTAVINGLLAENLGKNDLVRGAEARTRDAEYASDRAKHKARMAELEVELLEKKNKSLQAELEQYKHLLSRPMKEIAEISGDFKKTYQMQQQMLAEWILAQRAYKETATALGIQVGKSPEDVQKMASQNANAVLENHTQHGNNASTDPLLADHAATILAIRKKNGKA